MVMTVVAVLFQPGFPLICLVISVIGARRTRHTGFVFLVAASCLKLAVSPLIYGFYRMLNMDIESLNWIFSYGATFAEFLFWFFLVIGIWQLGIGRKAIRPHAGEKRL
jgi:hypothetical protein